MAIILKIVNEAVGVNEKIQIPLSGVIIFGRNTESDYRIKDEKCSGQHFSIEVIRGEIIVMDLDSKNGTFIDSKLIHKGKLYIGSSIIFGNTKISIDTKSLNLKEKKVLTRTQTSKGKDGSGLILDEQSTIIELTSGDIQSHADDKYNSGKSGISLVNSKKKIK